MLHALSVPSSNRVPVPLDQPGIAIYRERLPQVVQPGDIVCGFSLGAIVTAHCADLLAHAQAIVLFGVNPFADAPEKRAGRLALRDQVAERGAQRVFAKTPPPIFADDAGAVLESIIDMAVETQAQLPAQTQLALSRPGALSALAQSSTPVFALAGTKDIMTPLSDATAAADAAPAGQAITLEGLGHYALLENPHACADALRTAFSASQGDA